MTPLSRDAAESVLPSPLLLAEDEPLMQLRLRSILATLGYTDEDISLASSLAQARI